MFQGWGKNKNYFEGWYFKCIHQDSNHAFAFIPGIAINKQGEGHAFIQFLDGIQCKTQYYKFPLSEFKPAKDRFWIKIGTNVFSNEGIHIDLPDISGSLQFSALHPWPKRLGAPGIMGWYSFVPFMECNHGIVSLHHQLNGKLSYQGDELIFCEELGYAEKDWGRSFPSGWIWCQSNHFDNDRIQCLMASVANIPWLGSSFVGFITAFLFDGKLYQFATYTGAKMDISLAGEQVSLKFWDKNYSLELRATYKGGGSLAAPINGEMIGKVNESLKSELILKFEKQGRILTENKAIYAGLEIAGDIMDRI